MCTLQESRYPAPALAARSVSPAFATWRSICVPTARPHSPWKVGRGRRWEAGRGPRTTVPSPPLHSSALQPCLARQTLPLLRPELHGDLPQHAGIGGTRQASLQAQSLLQVRPRPPQPPLVLSDQAAPPIRGVIASTWEPGPAQPSQGLGLDVGGASGKPCLYLPKKRD